MQKTFFFIDIDSPEILKSFCCYVNRYHCTYSDAKSTTHLRSNTEEFSVVFHFFICLRTLSRRIFRFVILFNFLCSMHYFSFWEFWCYCKWFCWKWPINISYGKLCILFVMPSRSTNIFHSLSELRCTRASTCTLHAVISVNNYYLIATLFGSRTIWALFAPCSNRECISLVKCTSCILSKWEFILWCFNRFQRPSNAFRRSVQQMGEM